MAGSSGTMQRQIPIGGTIQRQIPIGGGFNVNTAASQSLQGAMGATGREMNYQPMQIRAAGYDPMANVRAGQIANTNLSQYMNPYENQVVQNTMSDLDRARQMTQNQIGSQATSARAFGGSRHGITEAETNRAFANQAANTAAQLRQGGFNQAQQMAQYDIGNRMQAGLANQAAINAARSFGAQNAMQAQQANQAAQLAGSQQRLGAAQQLAGLGQQGFNYGQQIAGQQLAQGGMAQALQQQLFDKATQQYQGYTQSPQQALNTLLAAVGAGNMGQQTQTTTKNPGLFDWASMAANAFATYKGSDARLKENVTPIGEIGGVKFYTWDWNEAGEAVKHPGQPAHGVIADELMETYPHLVIRGDDGYLRVDYNGLREELEAA